MNEILVMNEISFFLGIGFAVILILMAIEFISTRPARKERRLNRKLDKEIKALFPNVEIAEGVDRQNLLRHLKNIKRDSEEELRKLRNTTTQI